MTDEILPYYNRELTYIRHLAAQFADAHPKIAARLRLGADASQDPHVERLIEAFAYLSARLRHKLDDDFPEITESLLGVLYPHYQAPIPSMAIVQLGLDPEQDQLNNGLDVPRDTEIETKPIEGEPCRFRTCYPITLWPLEVRSASLNLPPFQAPVVQGTARATAVLRLVLGGRMRTTKLSTLNLDTLRFFLKGQGQHVYPLYELLFNNTMKIAVATAPDDPRPTVLDARHLRQVGFERAEGMLPYTKRSFLGYRLLSEYFAFPEKFLFMDITGLKCATLERAANQLELFFYLNKSSTDLEQNVSADTFRLGCAPIVNLFRRTAEPIRLTHTEFEYHLVPDARRLLANEVYSIDRVTATSPDKEVSEFMPFFSVRHAVGDRDAKTFWHPTRRPAEASQGVVDHGTEVYLSLVDLGFLPTAPGNWTLNVETTCLNRDLPHRLPFGGGQPYLQMSSGNALVSQITCLTAPTRTLRPAMKRGTLWRLISHLSLNHLSLVEHSEGADALREILLLYNFNDSPETRSLIEGVLNIGSRRTTARVEFHGTSALCRGLEVTIQFDEDRFVGSGLFVFASVLERFLALYCTVNSFTRLIATTKGRAGELRRWPPRMGERVLA
jgi:type VI secretion system protein ImpG